MGTKLVGTRVKRKEDPALLRGQGQYVDDIHLPGTLHAAFVRSPYAHARVLGIDTSRALEAPGVHAVYTFADIAQRFQTQRLPLQVPNPAIKQALTQPLLATEEVRFVGEAVAVVIADSRYAAEDGVDLVAVEYESLPAASDCREALRQDAPTVHAGAPDNLAATFTVGFGDVDAAFAKAPHVFSESLFQHRGCGNAMECRAVVAQFDQMEQKLTLWDSTQVPHRVKVALVEVLGLDEHAIRVIAPDVGGGFGPKAIVYIEEAIVPVCAMITGRPVKWVEDRREHFLSTTQERDQYWDVEVAADNNGKILGVRGRMSHDTGAYLPWGIIMPYIAATTMPGPYVLPSYKMTVDVIFTNKVPTTPVRGAGRPQAVFAMERLVDRIAAELNLDRAEVRRRNFIQADQMPYPVGLIYRDGSPVTYDSGDYPGLQAKTLEVADWEGFRTRQAEARKQGRYIGIGLANYVEGTGLGPFEGATVRVHPSGKVYVYTGAAPHGQAHKTTLAQVCADQLAVDLNDVTVVCADTDQIAMGMGTFASRIAVNAGSSVHIAADAVRQKALNMASHMLEASVEDLELSDGKVSVKGAPSRSLTFAQLARVATGGMPGYSMPGGLEPGLESTSYFSPKQSTYSNGSHSVEVEVDIELGEVKILRYVVGHDCGNMLNPMVVDGQVYGGVAHGVGNALYEWMKYDENAQPMTATFADYLMPLATDVPKMELVHMQTPTPLNPLGVKGAGEGGTIPAAAAIIAAVEDALSPFGVRVTETPITPVRILELLDGARAAS
jgi:carbon-monoxide dehydrogenase large subunit